MKLVDYLLEQDFVSSRNSSGTVCGQRGQLWREGGWLGQQGCPALPEHVWELWEKLSKCPGLHL